MVSTTKLSRRCSVTMVSLMLSFWISENVYLHRHSARRSNSLWLYPVERQSVQHVLAFWNNGHCRRTILDRRISLGWGLIDYRGVADSLVSVEQLVCEKKCFA